MAQHDYVIDNSTGANVRADINNALLAISSTNSGSSAPSTTYAFQLFANTTTSKLQIRNAANSAFVDLIGLDGSILLADGSVSSPSLAFSDDLNTGIFSSAADTFNVATGGVERMELAATEVVFNDTGVDCDFRIEGDGKANLFKVDAGNDRIGIGTSSPSDFLHLKDTTADVNLLLEATNTNKDARVKLLAHSGGLSQLRMGDQDDGDIGALTYDHSDNSLQFRVDNAERMRLDNNGQLLLGHSGSSQLAGILAQVNIETTAGANLTVKRNSNNEFDATINLGKTRATSIGGSTIVQQNDRLGTIAFFGSDGNDTGSNAAIIRAFCDGTPGVDDMPGRLVFMTTSDGANGATERLRINKTGMIMHGSSAARNTALMAASSQHQLEGVGSNASSFSIFCNSSGTAAGAIIFAKSKGNSIGSTTVVQENDSLGHIAFEGTDGSQNRTGARITATVDGAVSGGGAADMPTRLSFFTTQDGSGSETERLRIQQNGNVMIGTASHFTSNTAKLDVVHAGGGTNNPTYMARFFQETNDQGFDHACIQLRHQAAVSGQDGIAIDFRNRSGTTTGSIEQGQSTVGYNTSSDYRLKENIVNITDGITRIKQLSPKRFNFIADTTNTLQDGFIAHEVTPVIPEAVSGVKDATHTTYYDDFDDIPEGKAVGDIKEEAAVTPQSLDYAKFTPLLTAAIQEVISKVEMLEGKVAALEAA